MASLREVDERRLAWGLFGLLLLALLAVVVVPFLGTFTAAVFLYYAIRPVHRRVEDAVSRPNVAATLTLLVLVLPGLLVVAYAGAIGLQNLERLLAATDMEQIRGVLEPYLDVSGILQQPGQLLTELRQTGAVSPREALPAVVAALGAVFSVLLRLFLVLAFTFYLLRDDEKLSSWAREQLPAVGPDEPGSQGVFGEYVERVDRDLQSVYFGNLLNVFAIAILAVIANLGINVIAPSDGGIPYPVLLALLTGLGSLVPAVGMKIVYFPVAALLFATAATGGGPMWVPVVYLLVTLAVVDTIPDFFVRAYLSGGSLHMGLVMFSYILGPVVFGWYGLFLGPLLLVLVLHFGHTVVPALLHPRRA